MTLVWLIIIPFIAGLLAWISERWNKALPKWISLVTVIACFTLSVGIWIAHRNFSSGPPFPWFLVFEAPWIPRFGISFHLAMDGMSLALVILTFFLGVISVLCSWREIEDSLGFYYLNLLVTLSGITGVFLAVDLFLFYFFWEVMLIPMYFLIVIWGHGNRIYAAIKFFIFTQACSLLLLVAIIGLYFVHGKMTGNYTFSYPAILHSSLPPDISYWLMLGFFIAFAVKIPMVPLHTWLPDAHTEAPTAGSILLAGILLKTGGYGILRFVIPLFPDACRLFAPAIMALGTAGIVYGAVLAFAQTDLKRMVAYTSISHLGFVLVGAFAGNLLALQGAVMQMLCHGLSTGGLFFLVGALYERIHTRDMGEMGGFWDVMPRLSGVGLFLALASLGLPGMGNFVGEFMVLIGTFQSYPTIATISTLGIVAATIYSLWMVQKAFFGQLNSSRQLLDLGFRESIVSGCMIAGLVWLGINPGPVFNLVQVTLLMTIGGGL